MKNLFVKSVAAVSAVAMGIGSTIPISSICTLSAFAEGADVATTDAEQTVLGGTCRYQYVYDPDNYGSDDITWTYDTASDTLTLEGTGDFPSYYGRSYTPWQEKAIFGNSDFVFQPKSIVLKGDFSCYVNDFMKGIEDPVTITAEETVHLNGDNDLVSYYYGYYGSYAYYHVPLEKFIAVGTAENPFYSQDKTGVVWSFDYITRTLTISSGDFRYWELSQMPYAQSQAVYIGKDVTFSDENDITYTLDFDDEDDSNDQSYVVNRTVETLVGAFLSHASNKTPVYCEAGSPFDQEIQALQAYYDDYNTTLDYIEDETKRERSKQVTVYYYTSESGTMIGDVNGDAVVNLTDAITMNKYLVGSAELTEQQLKNANCDTTDGTATVDDSDVSALMRYLVQLEDNLPVTNE
jgi:hypothetical protein